jgi:hypothetical protein
MKIIKVVAIIMAVLVIGGRAGNADSISEIQYLKALPCIDTAMISQAGLFWELSYSVNDIFEHYYRKGEIDSVSQLFSFISKLL